MTMSMSKEAWAEDLSADLESGLHALDALERDFERAGGSAGASVPEGEETPVSTTQPTAQAQDPGQDLYPDLSNLTTTKIPHKNMILEGVCTHCAHCGHELTDSVSIQRGIGPVCSKKGYSEDPVEADETQALIDLAEYPELVAFLMEHYKPLGVRGLVNGLVRVASLNRPRGRGQCDGNASVHSACCDAIESLGHRKLAALLRETLVVLEVRDSEKYPGHAEVWIKKREWTKEWSWDLRRDTWGSFYCREVKATVVPMHKPGDPKSVACTGRTGPDGHHVTNKRALWDLMLKHYGGLVAKVRGSTVKIVEKEGAKAP